MMLLDSHRSTGGEFSAAQKQSSPDGEHERGKHVFPPILGLCAV